MKKLIGRFWPALAVLAGVALIGFEYRQEGGVTLNNAFWLFVGALIVVLGSLSLFQGRSEDRPNRRR